MSDPRATVTENTARPASMHRGTGHLSRTQHQHQRKAQHEAHTFDGPPSSVAWMEVLYRDRVLASLVNSGMRQRCAQAVTPRMSVLPSLPLTLNASRICSLIR